MPEQKTTPAALGLKLVEVGGYFSTFVVFVDPMTAFLFTLVAYVVTAKV
jgi:hypothetical protein